MRDIGKNIRELRIKKKMTQDALAESLFVSRQTVSNYENGKSRPDIDMLIKMAEVFGCELNTILYGRPAAADRRKELRGFLIALALSIASGFPLIFRDAAQKLWMRSFSGPKIALDFVVLPLFLLILGWTLMQGISLVSQAKAPNWKFRKYLVCLLLALLIFYFALFVPVLVHQIKVALVNVYIDSLNPPFGLRSGSDYTVEWLDKLFGSIWLFVLGKRWLFFASGVMLWLCGKNTLNSREKVILPLLGLSLALILCAFSESSFVLEVPDPATLADVPYNIQVTQMPEDQIH